MAGSIMDEVPRRSTFPPILQAQKPGVKPLSGSSRLANQWKATGGIRQLLEERGGRKGSMKSVGVHASAKGKAEAKASVAEKSLRTVDQIKREQELEMRRKRHMKAEATLKSWDALLQQERNERHFLLRQRVEIQRQLITKQNQLSHELRTKYEEKQQEEIRSRRMAHQEMVEAQRTHIQKIHEHKEQIARKLEEIANETAQRQDDELKSEAASDDVQGMHVVMEDKGDTNESEHQEDASGTRNTLGHVLRSDPEDEHAPTIEMMWGGWKADSMRRLQPIMAYSQQLKVFTPGASQAHNPLLASYRKGIQYNQKIASPSIQQCLEIYEQPTAHDRYTGKPIPLTNILSEISQGNSGAVQTSRASLLERSARQKQRKAEILLSRKDRLKSADSYQPDWYTEDYTNSQLEARPCTVKPKYECIKHRNTSPRMKKKLPVFLTSSGSVVSSSLVELGDEVYCRPSSKSGPIPNSVFLTDLDIEEQPSTQSRSQGKKEIKMMTPERTRSTSSWQPLSYSAVAEHRGVSELPVHGIGHHAHGKYKLWRPLEAIGN